MATSRIFFQNFITSAAQLSAIVTTGGAVGQSAATISEVQAVNSGSVTMTRTGTYTGLLDKTYYIQAYQSDGSFGGTRLQWSDTVIGTWNVTNITPSNGSPIALNSGLSITPAAGATTPYFVAGDLWMFRATLRRGPAQAIDGSRDTEWRSGNMPTSSTLEWRLDLGTSLTPGVFAILDHNIPVTATITLLNTASNFTTINSSTTVPWNAGKMIVLVSSGSSRYWVVRVTLTSTALTYARWSEIFLGTVESFDRTFSIGFTRERRRMGVVDVENQLMRGPGPRILDGDYLVLTYPHLLYSTDLDRLSRLWTWSNDTTSNVQRPFYFILLDSTLTDFSLYQWANTFRPEHQNGARYTVNMELAEVVRSIA